MPETRTERLVKAITLLITAFILSTAFMGLMRKRMIVPCTKKKPESKKSDPGISGLNFVEYKVEEDVEDDLEEAKDKDNCRLPGNRIMCESVLKPLLWMMPALFVAIFSISAILQTIFERDGQTTLTSKMVRSVLLGVFSSVIFAGLSLTYKQVNLGWLFFFSFSTALSTSAMQAFLDGVFDRK